MAQLIARRWLVSPVIHKDFRVCHPLLARSVFASVHLKHHKCVRAYKDIISMPPLDPSSAEGLRLCRARVCHALMNTCLIINARMNLGGIISPAVYHRTLRQLRELMDDDDLKLEEEQGGELS
jgi:hypothetical protein